MHESTTYLLPRISDVCSVLDKLYEKSIEAHATLESPIAHAKPEDLFVRGQDFEKALVNRTTVHFGGEKMSNHIAFDCQPQPSFHRNFEQIIEHLIENQSQGIRIIFSAVHNRRLTVFFELLMSWHPKIYLTFILCLSIADLSIGKTKWLAIH